MLMWHGEQNGDEVKSASSGDAIPDETEVVEGEVDEAAIDATDVEEGTSDEGATDAAPSVNKEATESDPPSKAKCCKCKNARNGHPVYSCSPNGSCGYCAEYGGRSRAQKIPAIGTNGCVKPSEWKLCKAAFEG